ncbi:type IV secretory pathway component VirB8 [Parvibaculum indicum]|uniref:hypothetical protein n=1 Tax=Parvibaculum indicum TaxID=562969 RepID=UPI0014247AE8|nr:hypothetical protein [Parvibaculum indicum]NIJ41764.1 type IV secretory pathway component VirB8 [Parvibaculum indicum]
MSGEEEKEDARERDRHKIEAPHWDEAMVKRRRQRNVAIAWVLVALVVLFFVVTIAKLGGNIASRPL